MQSVIDKYKRIRKNKFVKSAYKGKYAFVGIGNHSLNNLYPVLDYLKAGLKYIVTRSEESARVVDDNYRHTKGTTNLKKVLADKEITGVFVCASPSAHFEIAKQVLEAGKHLFIEKPPCMNLDELTILENTEKKSKGEAFVGLQKRFAPVYQILDNKLRTKTTRYYKLEYTAGNYPEGDAMMDLFIHPLDIVNHLFGTAKVDYSRKIESAKGVETWFLDLSHSGDITGRIELSTDFWWQRGKEKLTVNTDKQLFETEGISCLKAIDKPKSIMNVPLEKIKAPMISEHYLYQKNNFLPVRDHNDLFAAGYFGEIQAFLNMCENGKENQSTLASVRPVFELTEQLKTK
ncbi:MAG: Gfo/Idh/MocA family protein [Bacteroidales bacterium]